MIAIDTSALMAVLLEEPLGPACTQTIRGTQARLISAATLSEALIVADRRRLGPSMTRLLALYAPEVLPVTEPFARSAADAYARWGKGVHPARLNLMDCFAYVLARQAGCPLLYVGHDFAQTDVQSALPAEPS